MRRCCVQHHPFYHFREFWWRSSQHDGWIQIQMYRMDDYNVFFADAVYSSCMGELTASNGLHRFKHFAALPIKAVHRWNERRVRIHGTCEWDNNSVMYSIFVDKLNFNRCKINWNLILFGALGGCSVYRLIKPELISVRNL